MRNRPDLMEKARAFVSAGKALSREAVEWMLVKPRANWPPNKKETLFCTEIAYSGREASASPAVGSLARHKRGQARLIADAFSI